MEKIVKIIQELQANGKVVMYVIETNFKDPKVVSIVFECVKIYRKAIYAYIERSAYHEEKLYNINECYLTDREAREALRKNIAQEIERLKRLM